MDAVRLRRHVSAGERYHGRRRKADDGNGSHRRSLSPSPSALDPSTLLPGLRRLLARPLFSSTPDGLHRPRRLLTTDPLTGAEEELCWSGSRLVWTQGPSVRRAFDFGVEEKRIAEALWANFDVGPGGLLSSPPSSSSPTSLRSLKQQSDSGAERGSRKRRKTDPDEDVAASAASEVLASRSSDLFSATQCALRDNVRKHSPANLHVDHVEPSTRVRVLVVLLVGSSSSSTGLVKLYYPSGEEASVSLPFKAHRAWPLSAGVLFERSSDPDESESQPGSDTTAAEHSAHRRPVSYADGWNADTPLWRRPETSEDATAATYLLLESPLEDVKIVRKAERIFGPGAGELTRVEGPGLPFTDLNESIVFASDLSDDSPLPLVVTYNVFHRRLTVWRYTDGAHQEDQPSAAPPADQLAGSRSPRTAGEKDRGGMSSLGLGRPPPTAPSTASRPQPTRNPSYTTPYHPSTHQSEVSRRVSSRRTVSGAETSRRLSGRHERSVVVGLGGARERERDASEQLLDALMQPGGGVPGAGTAESGSNSMLLSAAGAGPGGEGTASAEGIHHLYPPHHRVGDVTMVGGETLLVGADEEHQDAATGMWWAMCWRGEIDEARSTDSAAKITAFFSSPTVFHIHIPFTCTLLSFSVSVVDRHTASERLCIRPLDDPALASLPAREAVPINVFGRAPRHRDVFVLRPDGLAEIRCYDMSSAIDFPLTVEAEASRDQDMQDRTASDVDMDMDISRSISTSARADDQIKSVELASCQTIIFGSEKGASLRASFDFSPRDDLVQRCMVVFDHVLDSPWAVKTAWWRLKWGGKDDWDALVDVLLGSGSDVSGDSQRRDPPGDPLGPILLSSSHTRHGDDISLACLDPLPAASTPSLPARSSEDAALRPASLPPLIFGFHLLASDLLLSLETQESLTRLVPLLTALARRLGRPDWADWWESRVPASVPLSEGQPSSLKDTAPLLPDPPDIMAHLLAHLHGVQLPPFPSVADVGRILNCPTAPKGGDEAGEPCKQTVRLLSVFSAFSMPLPAPPQSSAGRYSENARRAQAVVSAMVSAGVDSSELDRLPLSLALPLREAARACQVSPPSSWPPAAYGLVGRTDLQVQIGGRSSLAGGPERQDAPGVEAIRKGVERHLSLHPLSFARFSKDLRLMDVAQILQSHETMPIKFVDQPGLKEHDVARAEQALVQCVVQRNIAVCVGRGMFTFASAGIDVTERWPIPKIDMSAKILPRGHVVQLDMSAFAVDTSTWPEFHNGTAEGLRISPGTSELSSSWINYNRPADPNPAFAGYLFGLGLGGHLRSLHRFEARSYLIGRDDLTSIGLLLGLAASYVGSSDVTVTKIITPHVPALLPHRSLDLYIHTTVQAAGLLSLGLVYMGTENRRIADVLLRQIDCRQFMTKDGPDEYREAYSLSAAFAFGMIMLGKGKKVGEATQDGGKVSKKDATTKEEEQAIMTNADALKRLRLLLLGHPSDDAAGTQRRTDFDLSMTSTGATLALGLMYLKTNRADIAEMLEIPSTVVHLDSVRPDFLLLRTLARQLIMWRHIGASKASVEAALPPFIRDAMQKRAQAGVLDESIELAYHNMVAGACFALALKYAGSANAEAYSTLNHFLDLFTSRANLKATTYDEKVRRAAIRTCADLIVISTAMVVAGSGHVDLLRKLRLSHGQIYTDAAVPAHSYGTHMATHMALGLLFLGGGRFTLGTSNSAIAAMVIAAFPRFPSTSTDNAAHLQAYRHLWVLAVEPRCLVVKDVDTAETVFVPVKVKVLEEEAPGSPNLVARSQELISPTLVPDFARIVSIKTDSVRYWPLVLEVRRSADHARSLLDTQTIRVKRRTSHLSYAEDPRGNRSLSQRSAGLQVDGVHLSSQHHGIGELEGLVRAFSGGADHVALARHVRNALKDANSAGSSSSSFASFALTALMECVGEDKPSVLVDYIRLFRARQEILRQHHRSRANMALIDVLLLQDFYSSGAFQRLVGPDQGSPLIQRAFLESVVQSARTACEALLGVDAGDGMGSISSSSV